MNFDKQIRRLEIVGLIAVFVIGFLMGCLFMINIK